MFVEIAKPVTLIFCILSLYALFYTAFLAPTVGAHQRICDSLVMLTLAAGMSLLSGFIFRDSSPVPYTGLAGTLPVQLFCCATGAMLVLFLLSWYLESHCVLYRDVRF
jgi:hypothetical protein